MQLNLVRSELFGSEQCDFWQNEIGDVFMTNKQLGSAVGYADPQKGMDKLIERNPELRSVEFSVTVNMTGADGKQYETRIFNEDGIYESTLLAKTSNSAKFRSWVRAILKSLRKGSAVIINIESYMIEDPVKRAERWIQEQQERQLLVEQNNKKEEIINELKPKASYCDTVLQSKSLLATTIIAKDYGMTAQSLNKFLHESRVQYKVGECWVLYSDYANHGYTQNKTQILDEEKTKPHMYWTQKGRLFLYEFLKSKGILPVIERAA